MKAIRALLLVGSLTVGLAGESRAQFSLTIGNPYGGGIAIGNPGYGYSSGYSNYGGYGPGLGYAKNYQAYSNTGYLAGPGVIGGTYGYNSGYNGYAAPYGYSSGYNGYAAPYLYTTPNVVGYSNSAYYGSSVGRRYGMGLNPLPGFGARNVFRPFR